MTSVYVRMEPSSVTSFSEDCLVFRRAQHDLCTKTGMQLQDTTAKSRL